MNYIQFGCFLVYFFSALLYGIGIYRFINEKDKIALNRAVLLGETLLLGSIFIIGELLFLSLIGLYRAPYLWSIVLINYLLLFDSQTRNLFLGLVRKKITLDLPLLCFFFLIAILVFRNLYFLIDVDSLIHYLPAQKLWLSGGTSIAGGPNNNWAIFLPQFDYLPSCLGLVFFIQETLFPQMINLFWRIIVLFLVFGYTSYRFNRYYGLAAALFVALNEHIFYSGVNKWVVINGAVIAFLFAAAYNFWEARQQNSSFRLMLAVIFLSQLMANKYQTAYIFIFLLIAGILIQEKLSVKIIEIIRNKTWLLITVVSFLFVSLWYLKNFIITGNPVFPIFAGKMGTFGFTPQQSEIYYKVGSGIKIGLFLKYMNYLFIWPGINAGKVVIATISLLPLLLLINLNTKKPKDQIAELSFWLTLCILSVMGISLACHWEPRYHRYPIGIMSFAAVLSINFIFTNFNIKNKFIIGGVLLLLALRGGFNEGYRIILDQDGFFRRPSIKENVQVILNKIHTDHALRKVCPEIENINISLQKNNRLIESAAWDLVSFPFPLFFLPTRPVVSLWHSTTVSWNSYKSEPLIVEDLKKSGIKWVAQQGKGGAFVFVAIEEYAAVAAKYDLHFSKRFTCYDLPSELCKVD